MNIFRLLMFSLFTFFLTSCNDSSDNKKGNTKLSQKENEIKTEKKNSIPDLSSETEAEKKKLKTENKEKTELETVRQNIIEKAIKHDISCLLNNKENKNEPDELLAAKKRAEGNYDKLFNNGEDIIIGDKNAAVQIAIFFDPLDSSFAEFWKEVILKFKDSKNVCFKLFIISSIGDNEIKSLNPISLNAAKSCLIVSMIAPEKFNEFFEKISYERIEHLVDEYSEIAKNLKIDEERFLMMINSENISEKVSSNGNLTSEIVYSEELPLIFMNAPEKKIRILPPLDLEKFEKVILIMNELMSKKIKNETKKEIKQKVKIRIEDEKTSVEEKNTVEEKKSVAEVKTEVTPAVEEKTSVEEKNTEDDKKTEVTPAVEEKTPVEEKKTEVEEKKPVEEVKTVEEKTSVEEKNTEDDKKTEVTPAVEEKTETVEEIKEEFNNEENEERVKEIPIN